MLTKKKSKANNAVSHIPLTSSLFKNSPYHYLVLML